jgi:hypothetical protein
VTVVADVEGESSGVEEITEGYAHAQAGRPQKDAEAYANVERVEV